MANDYATIVGAPPRPDKARFLGWIEELLEARRRACDFHRTGPTYYFSQSGNDTTGNGSLATPWKTMAKANSVLAALSAENVTAGTSFLFQRGEVWRATAGISVVKNYVRFGSYGDPTAAKPILSYFTIRIDAGNSNWVNTNGGTDAKNAWYIPWGSVDANPGSFSSPGWIRDKHDPFNPFRAAASIADCENLPRSFFWSSGNSLLYVNPGYVCTSNGNRIVYPWHGGTGLDALKFTPDAIDFEITGDNGPNLSGNGSNLLPDGFVTSGAITGLLFENLRMDGWGCSALSWSSASGLRIASYGDSVVYVRDCENYYAGRHCMSLEAEAPNIGGRALFERCKAGYTNEVRNGGTIFNSYSQAGNECYHVDCEAVFGPLPDSYTSGWTGKPLAWAHGECLPYSAYFTHCNPGSQIGLYVNLRSKIIDNRDAYPYATACYFNLNLSRDDMPGTDADPTSWRVYVLGYRTHDSQPSRSGTNLPETSAVAIGLPTRGWFINSEAHLWKHWTGGSNMILGSGQWCAMLNTWLHIHDTTTTQSRLLNHASDDANLRVWWIGGGITADGPVSAGTRIAICGFASGNVRLANLVLVSRDKPLCLLTLPYEVDTSAQNSPTNISRLACLGCVDANSGNPIAGGAAGFDQAPGFVDLDGVVGGRAFDSSERISMGNVLCRAGTKRPFLDVAFGGAEYDFDGRIRIDTPSIGAFDVGASGGSGGHSSFVDSLVFELVG